MSRILIVWFAVAATVLDLLSATPAAAVGVPINIDDFSGSQLGTRSVTGSGSGTFTETGDGTAVMTMSAAGDTAGTVILTYDVSPTDLTSGGSNTQIFLEFDAIIRTLAQSWENAVSITVKIQDTNLVEGTVNTGISNVFAFNIAIDLCTTGTGHAGVCFSPNPTGRTIDFTRVNRVQLEFRYPTNRDPDGATEIYMSRVRTTPPGGVQPPRPTPTVSVPEGTTQYSTQAAGVNFEVDFGANGLPAPVTNSPPSALGLLGSSVVVSGTAPGQKTATVSGGPASYTVNVSGMTGEGTVHISIPANVVQDGWLSYNQASGNEPDVNYRFAIPPVLTSTSAATFFVGAPGAFTVTATGLPAPTFSVGGALPGGVSLDSTTGRLSGTPAVGTGNLYNLTMTATNVAASVNQAFALTVSEPPAITNLNTSVAFPFGTASSFSVTTRGYPKPTITESGALPAGVTFVDNGNGTATLSGTPAEGGLYGFTVFAGNNFGVAQRSFLLTVNQPPSITSAASATFVVGTAGSFTVTVPGYPAPTVTLTGALPAGVTFDAVTGVLGGTPAAGSGETYPLTISATNGIGSPATQSFTLTVNEAPAITSNSTTTFVVGTTGSFTVTTRGFPTPTITRTGTLPAGVTFVDNGNGTATVSGAATTTGQYPITIAASNGVGSPATQSFALIVGAPPAITSASSATFTIGIMNQVGVLTTGFPVPAITVSGALPIGVTLVDNRNGGAVLAGIPDLNTAGVYQLTLSATNGVPLPNGGGLSATQSFTLTVVPPLAITSPAGTVFNVGVPGSFTVTATGFPAATLSMTGALPAGVTFNTSTGVLSGTAAAGTGGSYPLTITAANGVGGQVTQNFTLVVLQAVAVTSASSTSFTAGTPGSFTVTAVGFPVPTVTLSGGLPAGVTFDSSTGALSGTPVAGTGGTYPVTITANNFQSPPAEQSFTLTISEAPAILSADSTGFTAGSAGSFIVKAIGFPAPTLALTGALPGGVTFNASTGELGGTPAAGTSGGYPVTITATNGVGSPATQSFTLKVEPASPTDIVLSDTSVEENLPSDTTVGTFSTIIADSGRDYEYSLVDGEGATDNLSFTIEGDELRTSESLDFESKAFYSIRVRTTDVAQSAISFDKVFTISVANVPEPPAVGSPTVANVTGTAATLGGTVTAAGESAVTERGIVYAATSANANPAIGAAGVTKLSTAGTTGAFTVGATGLAVNTGYSFKAYATNGAGTSYSAVRSFTTSAVADLAISMVDSPDPAQRNATLTYSIAITNSGPDAAESPTLSDAIPASTTFQSMAAPADWSCSTPAVGGGGVVSCSAASLASGATATFTLAVKLAGTIPDRTVVSNAAGVSSSTADPIASNNTATTTTAVGNKIVSTVADVTLKQNTAPAAPKVGKKLTYDITIANAGPGTATGVTMTDALPATVAFQSVNAPIGWTCAAPAVGNTGTVTCIAPSFVTGATASIKIGVVPTAAGALSNTATVTSTSSDPNLENNAETKTTTVTP